MQTKNTNKGDSRNYLIKLKIINAKTSHRSEEEEEEEKRTQAIKKTSAIRYQPDFTLNNCKFTFPFELFGKSRFVVEEWVRRWIWNDNLPIKYRFIASALLLAVDTPWFEHVDALCSYCLHYTPSVRPFDRTSKAIMFDMLHVIAHWHELMLFCSHQWNAGVNVLQSILFLPCTMSKISLQKCLIMSCAQ